ncbi:TerC/Alx family metal homeostasis membrane protein [Pseudoclavibacter chungangensis]|uniref:TerC/Alx family metal homeostasis membrane protein n=1 Tax=Pseudoclavibacter chungangensis TaxID=587635 RepID=A0A7J5BZM8_9MICO|nr:TerC/Alx family metal homeostasis membrane protein [Pseudoclavibacter chungangensis]KAB1659605.1 TerC/Alx family metal homeostasis membrane protein [Pseudoclavibacter chungangensis]NYJ67428.1 tellurite resistance protein TerC [Pseudoclavibacter chungangensis]
MDVPLWIWGVTIAVTIGFFFFDFYSHVKHAHVPSLKEAALWSLFYIALAVLLMVGIGFVWDWQHAGEFIGGYAAEKALSMDNLFVFLIIMTSFQVPKEAQQKVLLIGIAIALLVRTIFIIGGAAILEHFVWVFFIFGGYLIWMAIKLAVDSFKEDEEPEMPKWVGVFRKWFHTSEHYNSDKFTVVENGKRILTPMVIVVVALGLTDVVFALDSIPAIFTITQEAYLVFTANALALLGLRQLFFLIGGLLEKLVYLDLGLAVILAFIGVKAVLHALHDNELPFINGGENVAWAPDIPIWLSLLVIFGVLAIATIASLIATRGKSADEVFAEHPGAAAVEESRSFTKHNAESTEAAAVATDASAPVDDSDHGVSARTSSLELPSDDDK